MSRKRNIVKKLFACAIFPIWRRERQRYVMGKRKFGKGKSKCIKSTIFKTPGKLSVNVNHNYDFSHAFQRFLDPIIFFLRKPQKSQFEVKTASHDSPIFFHSLSSERAPVIWTIPSRNVSNVYPRQSQDKKK